MFSIGEIHVVDFEEFERVETFTRLYEVAHYISRRVSEEWLLEAVIEPAFRFQKAFRGEEHGLWFDDGSLVFIDKERLIEGGCKFLLDCANTYANIDYPVLMDIPEDGRILQANPSIVFDESGENPAFNLPVRREHDLDYHEIIVQLHQARDESLDFVESLRT